MSTWKYGPVKIQNSVGWSEPTEIEYSVEYQTNADYLSVFEDGKTEVMWEYFSARVSAKMISQWYLEYVMNYDKESVKKILSGEYRQKELSERLK